MGKKRYIQQAIKNSKQMKKDRINATSERYARDKFDTFDHLNKVMDNKANEDGVRMYSSETAYQARKAKARIVAAQTHVVDEIKPTAGKDGYRAPSKKGVVAQPARGKMKIKGKTKAPTGWYKTNQVAN